MLEKISDIREALNNKTYIAALALALTLPDICSQVENNRSNGNRTMYIDWVNKYMPPESFEAALSGFEKQEFDGEMCYSLRCKILHNGNTDVKSASLGVDVDSFRLVKPGSQYYKKGFHYREININGKPTYVTIIAVDYLCEQLCNAAERFYHSVQNKSLFDEHTFEL